MVDTDFLNAYSTSFYAGLPRLKADDVTGAVLYALSTSEQTQVYLKVKKLTGFQWNLLKVVTSKWNALKLNRILRWNFAQLLIGTHSMDFNKFSQFSCRSKKLYYRQCQNTDLEESNKKKRNKYSFMEQGQRIEKMLLLKQKWIKKNA